MYYMKPLKSPTHIHFWWKIFMDSRQFFALWFWDFLRILMRIMQSENFATYIHAHYRQSETAPIYAHYMREKFRLDIYKNCGAFEIGGQLIKLWYLCVSFVSCFVYVVIVWVRSFLLIGRCQSLVGKVWWDCINSL